MNPRLYLCLLHHPVKGRAGETIASAVTNLDLHDMARAGATYGVRRLYVATPLENQAVLCRRIVAHWTTGRGGESNPSRKKALELVTVCADLDAALGDVARDAGERPFVAATGAAARAGAMGYGELRDIVRTGSPVLLVFGTAWGLAEEVFGRADAALAPVRGVGEYNHLSVRSAASIILDRLLGEGG